MGSSFPPLDGVIAPGNLLFEFAPLENTQATPLDGQWLMIWQRRWDQIQNALHTSELFTIEFFRRHRQGDVFIIVLPAAPTGRRIYYRIKIIVPKLGAPRDEAVGEFGALLETTVHFFYQSVSASSFPPCGSARKTSHNDELYASDPYIDEKISEA
uniref:Uncharacterized protein n=2 Tax=Lepeophtheirus salmonis TaxID=72036 RepID=A0A0K2TRE7_LEPSM